MEKYECISVVGEGSYGLVMKCKHRESGQLVAIKKFIETEEDQAVRRIALREVRMLKRLRHENLVNMIEVFRRKRRFYLVFEYLDHTLLDELENHPRGLDHELCRQYTFQALRAVDFCHRNHIVHRDVKPENVLVSQLGVVKLCDFGFARLVSSPGGTYTDYVATRWYRAPELLVGDTRYGREVDIWAMGCLFAEIMSGDPLFPGDSDIDQLYHITKLLGKLSVRHQLLVSRNPVLKGLKRPGGAECEDPSRALQKMFPGWPHLALDLLGLCLELDPGLRASSEQLLEHAYFNHDRFPERFLPRLRANIQHEFQGNPLLRKYQAAILSSSSASRASGQQAARGGPPPERRPPEAGVLRAPPRKTSYCGEPAPELPLSSSPTTPYQSLESAPQVLHPSINNISLNVMGGRLVDGLKRSPQPPSLRCGSRAPAHTLPRNNNSSSSSSRQLLQHRLPPEQQAADQCRLHRATFGPEDFSLPCLPGANGSPNKGGKKKLLPIGVSQTVHNSDHYMSPL